MYVCMCVCFKGRGNSVAAVMESLVSEVCFIGNSLSAIPFPQKKEKEKEAMAVTGSSNVETVSHLVTKEVCLRAGLKVVRCRGV